MADVKARLSAYIQELPNKGPVIITRNGRTAAILLAPEDDVDLERLLFSRSLQLEAVLGRSRQSIKDGKGLSRDEFWKTVKSRNRKAVSKSVTRRKEE